MKVSIISKVLIVLFATISVALATEAHHGDTLHFVFELTRHGARAPTEQSDGFKVGAG